MTFDKFWQVPTKYPKDKKFCYCDTTNVWRKIVTPPLRIFVLVHIFPKHRKGLLSWALLVIICFDISPWDISRFRFSATFFLGKFFWTSRMQFLEGCWIYFARKVKFLHSMDQMDQFSFIWKYSFLKMFRRARKMHFWQPSWKSFYRKRDNFRLKSEID